MADALIKRTYGGTTPGPGQLEEAAAAMRQFDDRAREPEYYAALLHVALSSLFGPVGSDPPTVVCIGIEIV